MAQNEPRFGMPARRFKLAQFDRNHWHNKPESVAQIEPCYPGVQKVLKIKKLLFFT